MSQAPRRFNLNLSARNRCNQFLMDSLKKYKAIADARRLENQSNCYMKIMRSISKYPMPLVCQEQCLMLEGVGAKMGKTLKKLIQEQYSMYLQKPTFENAEENQLPEPDDEIPTQLLTQGHSQLNQDSEGSEPVLIKVRSQCEIESKQHREVEVDSVSVSSFSSINQGKYVLKEGTSAFYMLKLLYAEPEEARSKKYIKEQIKQIYNYDIKNWSFIKTLLKHDLIVQWPEELFKIRPSGIDVVKKHETKTAPVSVAYSQAIEQIDNKIASKTINIKILDRKSIKKEELGNYELFLLIDNRQVKDRQDRQYFSSKLQNKFKLKCKVSTLSLGDFVWVLQTEKEGTLVLDYIIERKISDDLAVSIVDGRYKNQKYRLKNCGIRNIFYIVQGNPSTHCCLDEGALKTAIMKTQLIEKFHVIKTEGAFNTMQYISLIHKKIQMQLLQKDTVQCNGTLEQFNEKCSKSHITVGNLFGQMIKCLPNVGPRTASLLTSKFDSFLQMSEVLLPLEQEQRLRFLSNIIRQSNKSNHESIAKLLLGILFGE